MSLDFNLFYVCDDNRIFVANHIVTHNLTKMADEAGIYTVLWRPEENGFTYAKDIVEILEKGLKDMRARPDYYKKFNPETGWGTYAGFVQLIEKVLSDCLKYPNAYIQSLR